MFTDINIDKRYRSNKNNIPCDFMIPMLMNATKYKRAVGYFSTSSLVNLSVGLAEMAKRGGHIEVVCSPKLSQEDLEAINYGYKAREKAFIEALDISLTNPVDEFEEERLNMVATLVAQGSLKFKLAFMERDTGINVYHEKIAVAYDENGNRISFTGSMNESENGLMNNFESIVVFCDWKSEDQKQYIDEVEADFELLWKDNTEKVRVIEFPQIIIEKLLKFQKTQVDYDIEQKQFGADLKSLIKKKFVTMPSGISLMAYQKEAILKWREQEYIGIYDMATGTGKTYTALGSIEYLAKELENQIAVFILCPYVHLVGQWEEDVLAWGGKPIIAHSQSPDKQWEQHLIDSYKRFKTIKKPFVCITTNDTYTGDRLQSIIQNIKADMNVLLIVDEAHNVGAQKISRFLNENIKYRLALSATIERYQDKKGTEIIFKYFKEKCIEYSLNKAIEEGKALCNYEYHVIYSFLSPQELDRYNRITKELKNYMKYDNGKAKYTKAAQVKLFERKRILAGAKDKVGLLKEAMGAYRNEKHILVYCGATNMFDEDTETNEKQILKVSRMLETELGMDVHKFTAEENAEQRVTIKKCFEKGMYQVLTAIKCLDEGVNIPNIQTAFILSSSQNPKEFIQRRGRLLRKAKGKDRAVIYDFVTLPRPFGSIHYGDFETDKSIVIGEMIRIKEFSEVALNKAEGLNIIDEIQAAYGVSIDLEFEIEKRKEEEFDE
ncbi:MAG: DEAD/DEAH box helicase family protein [Lachnospiraceae bacterium]|nr:DEAD/DEAH box helicase family protein [Lachnospiraceae bacterium]